MNPEPLPLEEGSLYDFRRATRRFSHNRRQMPKNELVKGKVFEKTYRVSSGFNNRENKVCEWHLHFFGGPVSFAKSGR